MLSLPICSTNEGVVLQLIDCEQNVVIGMMKVKAIEYSLFCLMTSVLMQAIERGEIENIDRVMQTYGKQHRALVKDVKKLPNEESFYFEVFTAAYTMVSQRKSP